MPEILLFTNATKQENNGLFPKPSLIKSSDDITTALIVAVGEKDDARLGGSYFKPYTNDKNLKGYAVNAYVYSELPSNSFGATDVRNMFRNNRMGGERKQKEFEKFWKKIIT